MKGMRGMKLWMRLEHTWGMGGSRCRRCKGFNCCRRCNGCRRCSGCNRWNFV